jgi:phosphatidylglycerol---prolipoprotein diacylglyceryl transferase
MHLPSPASRADNGPSYPRYFRIAGQWVNCYKVFLCVGIYLGILVIAALAQSSGIPPLGVALGSLALAIIGLAGARVYHLLVYHPLYFGRNACQDVWNSKDGGSSVFGAFLAMAPCSFAVARLIDVPANVVDHCHR